MTPRSPEQMLGASMLKLGIGFALMVVSNVPTHPLASIPFNVNVVSVLMVGLYIVPPPTLLLF
jgi:hypothetical protein